MHKKLSEISIEKLMDSILDSDKIDDDIAEISHRMKRTLIKKYVDDRLEQIPCKIREITEKNGKHYFYVQKKNIGLKVKGSSLNNLYDNLYSLFTKGEDYTFKHMFEEAIGRKALQSNSENNTSSSNTIHKDRANYNRYITEEFGNTDIREITPESLNKYIIETLIRLNKSLGKKLGDKAFLSFKSILNMAFSYAEMKDICSNFISNKNKFRNSDYTAYLDKTKKKAQQKAFSPIQITKMKKEVVKRIEEWKEKGKCFTNGYIFLMSLNTGMRDAELVSLKWDDIDYERMHIHIHSQQLKKQGTREYEYVEWTKNEKGVSQDGRYFPLSDDIVNVLDELKECQEGFNIKSEWVFANPDGSWIKADTMYEKFLQRLCKSLGFRNTNNHAIRMYFNSYVLIPLGVTVNNRARLLGHSVEVNLKFYTFEDYDYCENTRNMLNSKGF